MKKAPLAFFAALAASSCSPLSAPPPRNMIYEGKFLPCEEVNRIEREKGTPEEALFDCEFILRMK